MCNLTIPLLTVVSPAFSQVSDANFAVSGNRPQQNATHEFNLRTDSCNADYGKHPSGQVVIVTQQGTNQFHGSLFEFLRNNDLNARDL
jgi:hypothetical protein